MMQFAKLHYVKTTYLHTQFTTHILRYTGTSYLSEIHVEITTLKFLTS